MKRAAKKLRQEQTLTLGVTRTWQSFSQINNLNLTELADPTQILFIRKYLEANDLPNDLHGFKLCFSTFEMAELEPMLPIAKRRLPSPDVELQPLAQEAYNEKNAETKGLAGLLRFQEGSTSKRCGPGFVSVT